VTELRPYYPEWLGPALLDGAIDNTPTVETTLSEFLDAYTLHDSHWIALVIDGYSEARLVIRFDAFWSDGRIPHPGPSVAEWPILVVTMRHLLSARIDLRDSGIAGAISLPHDSVAGMSTTFVQDHRDGSAELVHGSSIEASCFDSKGTPIPIAFD
jgi:hypothetical protein